MKTQKKKKSKKNIIPLHHTVKTVPRPTDGTAPQKTKNSEKE